MRSRPVLAALGLVALLAAPSAHAADWGTIKGRVIWGGKEPPKVKPIVVTKDGPDCDKCGLVDETYVVDPKTKGVRWAVVWLIPLDTMNKDAKLPIHPDLAKLSEERVFIDQPCCKFEPRVLCIRVGQKLTVKNSSLIAHNIMMNGTGGNPSFNVTIPAGGKHDVLDDWKPTPGGAVSFNCNIHSWMNGYVRVFSHPYYAVTNAQGEFEIKKAPAGKFRLVIWQEVWVVGEKQPDRYGIPIEIKKDAVTDLGEFKMPEPPPEPMKEKK
jgi:plastocyanin